MYVYILRSLQCSDKYYVGSTKDLKHRLSEHNRGESEYTKVFRPWKLETALWFSSLEKAVQFEKYLKTQSGRAFCKKHF